MTYANQTTVSVSKSRGEIDSLLQKWGARQVVWGDDWEAGQVLLKFVWVHDEADYGARFILQLATNDEVRSRSHHATNGQFLQNKFDKLCADRGKSEHRLLLLWLKAYFNAVEAGLVTAEQLFMPFLEGVDGRTVSEMFLPKLHTMLEAGGTRNLLLDAGEV